VYDISDQRAEAMYDKIYEILEKYGFGGTLDAMLYYGLAKDLYRLVGDAYGEGYAEGSSDIASWREWEKDNEPPNKR
jgi:hypothetical protein